MVEIGILFGPIPNASLKPWALNPLWRQWRQWSGVIRVRGCKGSTLLWKEWDTLAPYRLQQYSGQKTQRPRLFSIQPQYVTSQIQRQSVAPTGVSWELVGATLCCSDRGVIYWGWMEKRRGRCVFWTQCVLMPFEDESAMTLCIIENKKWNVLIHSQCFKHNVTPKRWSSMWLYNDYPICRVTFLVTKLIMATKTKNQYMFCISS